MSKIFSNALFEAKERESAVSPVVGVMLMLVVTIIIAATVSAFAGGLVGTADKAPTAAFDVKINIEHQYYGYGYYYHARTMVINHLGGDPVDTSRLKIITSWTNKTTNEEYYRETTALPHSSTPYVYNTTTGKTIDLDVATANYNSSYAYQEPYFVIPKVFPHDDASVWFGNFILHPGEIMKVEGSNNKEYNTNGYADYSVIKEAALLSDKDSVNVKFIDIPTGNVIYDQKIYVTEATVDNS